MIVDQLGHRGGGAFAGVAAHVPAQFLMQVLEGGDDRSTARVTERSTNYDPDGFYLNEGPNGDRTTRETRRQRLDRLFEESGDDPASFTLF